MKKTGLNSQRAVQKPLTQSLEIEVLLTFAEYVGGAVDVGISHPAVGETVQAAPDSFPAERSCIGGIRLVYGNVIQIQAAGLRGIRFFLFQIGYPVAFTQVFQGIAQIAQIDLSEVLICHFT